MSEYKNTTPDAKSLSEDERTPKHAKFTNPDLTVVIDGVEFYHYKLLLGMSCPYFERMLTVDMKESSESRVEFEDKDPNVWLQVYKFLDPTAATEAERDSIIKSFLPVETVAHIQIYSLITWFDYLGMSELLQKLDKIVAEHNAKAYSGGKFSYLSYWEICKNVPCPLVQKTLKAKTKNLILRIAYYLSRNEERRPLFEDIIKPYLLDDQCGDEMWQYLLSNVDFPDKMLETMDRETIVNSPFFEHMLEVCGRSLTESPAFEFSLDEADSNP
jgi:hypothetical protein